MEFKGLDALEQGFPTIEFRSGGYRFDIHNAAELIRVSLDFKSRLFTAEWRVENLLASPYYGPYRVAQITLAVSGIRGVRGSTELTAGGDDPTGIDFIELVSKPDVPDVLRFVFTSDGEITVAGDQCELHCSVSA